MRSAESGRGVAAAEEALSSIPCGAGSGSCATDDADRRIAASARTTGSRHQTRLALQSACLVLWSFVRFITLYGS